MQELPRHHPIYMPEFLYLLNKEVGYDQKVLIDKYFSLDEMHGMALKAFAELMLHPAIEWDLPEDSPPYQPASGHVDQSPSNLFRVFKELSYFLKGGYGFITNNEKRETHFVVTLESLSAQEASLLCQIKDRNLKEYPNVDMYHFIEMYPEWFPEGFAESFLEQKKVLKPKTGLDVVKTIVRKAGRPSKKDTK